MSDVNIGSVVESISADLKAIDASIGQSLAGLADAYRALVKLIQSNSGAFVDETGKLKAGVLDNVMRIAPNVDRSTFSSAWSAFKANPEAFESAQAVRKFSQIVKEHKAGGADKAAQNEMARALERVGDAIRKAAEAGISAVTIADMIRAAYSKPAPKAAEVKADEPQAEPIAAPTQEPKADESKPARKAA